MSTGFLELGNNQLTQALQELLVPQMKNLIASRDLGHCMRVADLDLQLMFGLTKALRREIADAQVFILSDGQETFKDKSLFISSTKLVELRNPLPDGALRSPLLVFLPANLHTNAEDSFNVASFEDISVADVYEHLVKTLLQRIPPPLQGYVREIFNTLSAKNWTWADAVAQARFLLTAISNGNDGDTLGASLYELGLVPDFHLFDELSITSGRIIKNLECVKNLTDSDLSIRGRVLDLGLSDKIVQRQLTQLLVSTGVENPRTWEREIVLNRNNWDISFDKWKFLKDNHPDKVSLEILQIDLPKVEENVTEETLQSLVGTQVLIPEERRNFKVDFEVNPHPAQVQGLSYFTIQILSQDSSPVGSVKKVNIWKTKKNTKTVTLDKLNKFEFDEGWHLVRILPWTEDGSPIPLSESKEQSKNAKLNKNESELFYVLPGGTLDEEPPQRATPKEDSLEHAKLKLQFTAISNARDPQAIIVKDVVWADKSSKTRNATQETLEVKFGREGKFQIPVAKFLKQLEQKILANPQRSVNWRLLVQMGRNESFIEDIQDWPISSAAESFLAARANYFAAILQGEKELISQAADFAALKDVCFEYAGAYRDLLLDFRRQIERSGGSDYQALKDLRNVLAVDTVRILITDFRGHTREALLVGPTHPLRALWLVTWAHIGQQWVTAAREGAADYVGSAREGILRGLVPLNLPSTLPLGDGRIFLTVDNIHPFWSLYAPATEQDPRGLLGEICAALGVAEPAISGAAITGEILADRIERYLVQHPYVSTLSINVFNPGRAQLLADALTFLQKGHTFTELRYDIRLFVSDPEAPGVGEAVEQLLSPSGVDRIDAFSTSSGSHLFPKLNLAIHSIDHFRSSPDVYQAHLGILLDLFPAEETGSASPLCEHEIAPLHGLIQDFAIKFQDDENGTFWKRQPCHGKARHLPGAEGLIDLLAELPQIMSGATVTAATGAPAFFDRPVVTLGLKAEQRQLIHHIHQACDWVFTIDRNMGIEFFDHGGKIERPPYLVDYVPNPTASFGHRLVITSRSLSELEFILSQVLAQYGLKAERNQVAVILEQLRSLSGRLALKLISSPQQQAEVLGLALARLFLEYQGALSNQIVVPLDAHLDLFRAAKQQAMELDEAVSLQRTDLALFNLNATTQTVLCNLVEIKCYTHISSTSNFNRLKEEVAQQINQSENVLRRHFEPIERPDRLLKTREFTILLEFYLNRAERYGLLDEAAAESARLLLASLEEGYNLQFSRSALIFDFDKPGTEPPEQESGIEFHRIGIDLIEALVAEAKPTKAELLPEPDSKSELSSVPLLTTASFIVPKRETTTALYSSQTQEQKTFQKALPDESLMSSASQETTSPNQSSGLEKEQGASEAPTSTPCVDQLPSEGNNQQDVPVPLEIESNSTDSGYLSSDLHLGTEELHDVEVAYDIMLGVQGKSPQYGLLGEIFGRKVALDLNQTNTISLFGVQGAGKSYTLGSIIEMACLSIPQINALPRPLAAIVFHYSPTQDYKPEFTSMVRPNSEPSQLMLLRERYGAEPVALKDVAILVPPSKVDERKAEYPNIEVLPITFAASELKATHWKFLMGAVGSQSLYLRQINLTMKKLRDAITLEGILHGIESSYLSDHLKELAKTRLEFAAEYIDDSRKLSDVVRPGRLIVVDLRDEFIEKDEALGLFVVLLQIFSEATYQGTSFNKFVVFDEAHKYIENSDLVAGLIEVVREMRHKGTSIMVASQDPPSVPVSLIELSSQIILHRFNSPAWLKHIQKANAALNSLTPEQMSNLGSGEAYVWSGKATDESFTKGVQKIRCRPRVTQHGGSTKTAVTEN